jgi:hypothetical protein
MLANVLRRGSAYLLATHVSTEGRCARMGHTETDGVYWRYYRNKTSTVDFQALRHGIPEKEVAVMSSVFLNVDDSRPPEKVSNEGMAEILRDTELIAITTEGSELSEELLEKYGSLKDALAEDPQLHQR